MRLLPLLAAALLLAPPALAGDPGGISNPALSRCAAKMGTETRELDPAFGLLFLDGMPWMTIERTEKKIESLQLATILASIGALRRRDGTLWPFRFTCVLDDKGQAAMFHASGLLSALGDQLAPARLINGVARLPEKMPVERGTELRVQLLDTAGRDIAAEQIVRSGWVEPIPFSLRLPLATRLEGRKLALTAKVVLADQVLFELPQPLAADGLAGPHELALQKVDTAKR